MQEQKRLHRPFAAPRFQAARRFVTTPATGKRCANQPGSATTSSLRRPVGQRENQARQHLHAAFTTRPERFKREISGLHKGARPDLTHQAVSAAIYLRELAFAQRQWLLDQFETVAVPVDVVLRSTGKASESASEQPQSLRCPSRLADHPGRQLWPEMGQRATTGRRRQRRGADCPCSRAMNRARFAAAALALMAAPGLAGLGGHHRPRPHPDRGRSSNNRRERDLLDRHAARAGAWRALGVRQRTGGTPIRTVRDWFLSANQKACDAAPRPRPPCSHVLF